MSLLAQESRVQHIQADRWTLRVQKFHLLPGANQVRALIECLLLSRRNLKTNFQMDKSIVHPYHAYTPLPVEIFNAPIKVLVGNNRELELLLLVPLLPVLAGTVA